MLGRLRPLLRILTPDEARRAILLLLAVALVAALEAAAIAATLPFLQALLAPDLSGRGGLLDLLRPLYAVVGHRPRVLLGAAFIAALVGANMASLLVNAAQLRFVYGTADRVATRLLRTYLHRPFHLVVEADHAKMSRNILEESTLIAQSVLRPITLIVSALAILAAIFVVLLLVAPLPALAIMLALGGAYGLFYAGLRRSTEQSGIEKAEASRQRFAAVSEALGGMRTTRVHGGEELFVERFRQASARHARLTAKNQVRQILPRSIVDTLAVTGLVAVGFYFDLVGGDIRSSLPTLGLLAFAAYRMMPLFQQILANVTHLRFHHAVLDNLARELSDGPTPQPRGAPVARPLRESVRLEAVSVEQPPTQRRALDGVTIAIPRGSTVAIVGKTGAGKSTLADVVVGLRPPTSGALLIDGAPLRPEDLAAWQATIGYVPQHVFIANDTLRNNIAFGVDPTEIDEVRLHEAARRAHVEEFVATLSAGYDTVLGERGVRLSGGQQQRIGIARALYRQPALLVLDEATSDLDTLTERAITDSIAELRGRMTTLIVAHRLATIERADRIYLLDAGRVVASGAYADLLRDEPRFEALARERAHRPLAP